jgi:hypothetical protein
MATAILTAPVLTDDDGVGEHQGFLDPAEAARIHRLCRDAPIPSSLFYLPVDALDAEAIAEYLPLPLASFVTVYLRRLLAVAPAAMRARAHGFELWTTQAERDPAAQVYLHVDCDEQLRVDHGVVRTPMLGSVLYLGPHGMRGGETLFLAPHRFAPFAFHERAALEAGGGARVVVAEPGTLALFAGHVAHGRAPVIDHPDGAPRITLLANLWDAPIGRVPHGICALSPADFHRRREVA